MFERTDVPDDLTVVVVSLVGGAALDACLGALTPQASRITVVGRGAPDQTGSVLPVPVLRMAALRAAQSPYVAFIEDTAMPDANWAQGLRTALAGSDALAAAGPILISPRLSARGRALGLSEYARFQSTETGRASALPGLAFAVARGAALSVLGDPPEGLVEGDLFRRLVAAGRTVGASQATVVYTAEHEQGARLRTRFRHGRLFAGRRFPRTFLARRLTYAAGALALPPIMVRRALQGRPPELSVGPGVFGWLCLMSLAWSAGEVVGYLTGDVGDAAESWT